MRTLNIRLLALLFVGALLTAAVGYGLHGYQVRRNAGSLLRQAAAAKAAAVEAGNAADAAAADAVNLTPDEKIEHAKVVERERKVEHDKKIEAIDCLQRYVSLVPRGNGEALADLGLLQADVKRNGQALRNLLSALRQLPDRPDLRRRLVKVQIDERRYQDAIPQLKSLLKDKGNENDSELLEMLARCQVSTGEDKAAVDSLEAAIDADPNRLEPYVFLAAIYAERLNQGAEARTKLDQMVAENSTEAKAYMFRGSFMMEHPETPLVDTDGADKAAIPLEPHEQKKQANAAALEDARAALELGSDDENVILFVVRCFLANKMPDDARKYAERARELFPNNPTVYALLADVELRSNNRKAAIDWLDQGVKVAPKDQKQDYLWNLCNLYLDLEESSLDEDRSKIVRFRLNDLRKAKYPIPPLEYLEARLLTVEKPSKWLEASVKLEKNRAALVPWPDLSKQSDFLLGKCYEGLGNPDMQLTAFRRAASVDPLWVPARLGVAGALASMGNIDEALGEYTDIVKLSDKADVGMLLEMARMMIMSNLRRKPAERDWGTTMALLDKIDDVAPNLSQVAILRAEVLLAQEKTANALTVLLTARDLSPKDTELWLGLAAISDQRGEWSEARRILDEAKVKNGDSVPLRLALARSLVNQREPNVREEMYKLVKPAPGFTTEETMQLYAGMARLLFMLEDYDETARLCKAVAKERPSDLLTRLMLFDTAIRATEWTIDKRLAVMSDVLEEMLEISGKSPLWHYGMAVQLRIMADDAQKKIDGAKSDVERKKSTAVLFNYFQDAKQHLALAGTSRRRWARIPLLLADINMAQGDERTALDNYLDAIQNGEQNPSILSRTVILLTKYGKLREADELIRRLDQDARSPFSNDLVRLATEISLELSDKDRALDLTTNRFRAKSADEHIWAGQIYANLRKPIEAEASFRSAIKIDETQPTPWIALIQFLGRMGNFEKARAEFEEAEKKIDPKAASAALARCIQFTGQSFEEMEARHQATLAANPKDVAAIRQLVEFYFSQQRQKKAEPLLQQIVSGEINATVEDLSWARRNLALALATHMDRPAITKKALALLDENINSDKASNDDRRAKAMVLSNTKERGDKLEAIDLFEKLLKDQPQDSPQTAEERFVLAQVYNAIGDWPKVTSHMRTLLATHGDEPRYVKKYVEFLLKRDSISEADEAAALLRGLEKVREPKPQDVYSDLTFSIETSYVRERYDEILSAIDAFMDDPAIDAAQRRDRMRRAATLLEAYSERLKKGGHVDAKPSEATTALSVRFIDRAEELFRRNARENPSEALVLAGYCSRHGKLDEALEILERTWSTAQPVEITTVTITLMISPAATPQQLARVDKVLRAAIEKTDRHLLLVQALADLLSWREEYDEAETLYRESLSKGEHPLALNNMALLLALRGKGGNESLQLIEKAVELVGLDPSLLDSRATINLALGNPQLARPDLLLAIEKRKDSPLSYFHQAQVELRLGLKDAARNSMSTANELGLQVENLHPLERKNYRQLQQELR